MEPGDKTEESTEETKNLEEEIKNDPESKRDLMLSLKVVSRCN